MIVKDVLVEALARANHCQRGFGADASEVVMVEKHFNSQMRKYSDSNLITAYQKIWNIPGDDITESIEEDGIVIGKPTYKKGVRITEGTALPSITTWLNSGHIIGRDYFYITEGENVGYWGPVPSALTGKVTVNNDTQTTSTILEDTDVCETDHSTTGWKLSEEKTIASGGSVTVDMYANEAVTALIGHPITVQMVNSEWTSGSIASAEVTSYNWGPINKDTIIETGVDVKVNDMVKIMSAMFKDNYGKWRTLQFIPLTDFYINDMNDVYNSANDGENKIRLRLKKDKVGKDIRLVYNCSMKFDKSQTIELPEAHIELLTLATTVAIITEDGDADQSMLQNYQAQLSDLEAQIKASTLVTRRITREPNGFYGMNRIDYLKSGLWI